MPLLAQVLSELRTEARAEEIALGPLSAADSLALARSLQPSARRDAAFRRLLDEIWTISEGNPFVIVESVRAIAEGSPEAWSAEARLARTVQEVVAARLNRLSDRQRQIVDAAAAIGRDFSFPLLAAAAGLGEREAADATEALVRRQILTSDGNRLGFRHDWIRARRL